MSSKKLWVLIGILLLAGIVMSVLAYPRLSEQMITHWDAQGRPNGYSSRLVGVAILPLMLAILAPLLYFIPYIDPLRTNIEAFRTEYNLFLAGFAVFMVYIHALSLAENLGLHLNMSLAIVPPMAFFCWLTGMLLGRAKRNFFIGIRTPWTLSSDAVWKQTHRRGGQLFKAAGVIILFSLVFPSMAFFLMIVPLLGVALYLVVYSYFLYRREISSR